MKVLFALALASIGSAGAAQERQVYPERPAPRLERIEMDVRSWGKPMSAWTIDASGVVRYTRPEPDVHSAKQIVTRRYAAGTAGFRRIRVLIGLAEQYAGATLRCSQLYTDAPYGEVRWVQSVGRRTVKLDYYYACRETVARNLVDPLKKADAQVAAWGMKGEIVETRTVESQ